MRFALLFALLFAMPALVASQSLFAEPPTTPLPKETDTLLIGQSVVLTQVRGTMYRVILEPVTTGATVKPGDVLLVPKGTAFSLGQTLVGAERHGDRFVRIQ